MSAACPRPVVFTSYNATDTCRCSQTESRWGYPSPNAATMTPRGPGGQLPFLCGHYLLLLVERNSLKHEDRSLHFFKGICTHPIWLDGFYVCSGGAPKCCGVLSTSIHNLSRVTMIAASISCSPSTHCQSVLRYPPFLIASICAKQSLRQLIRYSSRS